LPISRKKVFAKNGILSTTKIKLKNIINCFLGSNALLNIFLIHKFQFIQVPGIYLSLAALAALAALVSIFAFIPLIKHQYS